MENLLESRRRSFSRHVFCKHYGRCRQSVNKMFVHAIYLGVFIVSQKKSFKTSFGVFTRNFAPLELLKFPFLASFRL